MRDGTGSSGWRSAVLGSLALGVSTVASSGVAGPVPREQAEFFEAKVRPVLAESCAGCHGARKQASGLRLDGRAAVLKGGDSGPAVVPGDPEASALVQAVRRTHAELKMPPKRALPAAQVEALAAWVKMGAPWPEDAPSTRNGSGPVPAHWAFRPVRPVRVPEVGASGWGRTPVDAFVLDGLRQAGLEPSPEADRRTLIRRVTFDLIGLPPTPGEVEAFARDPGPDAYHRLVERLLASPRYGERRARHWLDVARYADTKGYIFLEERRFPYSYTYRDYVIRAFNADTPYDTFVVEQLAADRLGGDPRSLAAMGFLTLGRRFLGNPHDIIDDRLDVVGRGLLGLTVSCARCHDHKFDPIPTADYYALYGVFASSVEPPVLPELPSEAAPAVVRDFQAQLQRREGAVDTYLAGRLDAVRGELRRRAGAYLRAAADLGFNPDHPGLDARARQDKLGVERLRGIIRRWRSALDATRNAPDPVFAPWHALATLPEAEFSRKAPSVAKSLAAAGDSSSANPVVAEALAAEPPSSVADLAARYARVLDEAEARWRAAETLGANALPEPAWEELRRVLYADGGPVTVPASELRGLLDAGERNALTKVGNGVAALKAAHPGAPPRAMVLNDLPAPVEPRVFLRGNPNRPGKAVPRQFLGVLAGPGRTPFRDGSGRLELARAIASPGNPLTARVMVNRVWMHHFGAALVGTPGDFGTRSDPPTHPELLDWLAGEFVRGGWSVKALHRHLLLSAAYRQRSEPRAQGLAKDPSNRLYWRFNRRRLDFEATRDAVLAVSGALESRIGGPALAVNEPPFPPRRTVYGFIDRQNLDGVYRAFDFASPDTTSPRRFVTTVPQQALFLMNSPFVLGQARLLASRPEVASGDPGSRARALYARLFGRDPGPDELALAAGFVGRPGRDAAGLSRWEQYAQVLLLTNEFVFVD